MSRVNVDMNLTPVISRGAQSPERDGRDNPARAWQREMERAQMEAWLSHAVIEFPGAMQKALMPPLLAATANASASVVRNGTGGIDFASGVSAFGKNSPAVAASGTAALAAQRAETANARTHDHAGSAAPDAAGSSALRSTLPAATSEARERAQFKGDLSTESAHLRTAQLASLFRGLGPVESTTSIAGQVMPAQSAVAAQAAPLVVPAVAPPHGLTRDDPRPLQATSFQWPAATANLPAAMTAAVPVSPAYGDQEIASAAMGSPGEARTPAPGGSMTTHSAGPTAMHAARREPIRMHADWSPEGVRLWLGMDPAVVDALRAITAQLQRWLSAQSVRLLSISCNGTLVADERETAVADIFETDTKKDEPAGPIRSHSNLKESP